MKFPIGQTFRVSYVTNATTDGSSSHPDLRVVTKGRHAKGMDVQKGMFFFQSVRDGGGQPRRPALILTSNDHKRTTLFNPWHDIIEEDRGYALYHGDNRHPERPPEKARGNREFLRIVQQYSDPKLREVAPPILLFKQTTVGGQVYGFRQFSGFGVPTSVRVQTQVSKAGHFTNLAIELALFSTDAELGIFDWAWIDARRDQALSAAEANQFAPEAWRQWVKHGHVAVDRLRRLVFTSPVVPTAMQSAVGSRDKELLLEVHSHYTSEPHQFEALASLVTQRVLGSGCRRGWVTRRSGDGGIDFVSRLDLGSGFSSVALVVLGQAKAILPGSAVSAKDLARVAARLQRGWIGAFDTTGTFSEQAQKERSADGYPLVLINGRRLADELRKESAVSGLAPREIFGRESEWYQSNLSSMPPERVLSDQLSGHEVWPSRSPI